MGEFPDRYRILTAKVEVTPGTDVTPTVAANAIKTEGADWQPEYQVDEPNEDTGSLDTGDPVVTRGRARMTAGWRLKGASAPGTTAPECDPILRAAGLARTLTAAAVTGTASAGASGSITLAGKSSTDDAYNGMVITLTGGTGSGQTRVIYDYVGGTGVTSVTPAWTTTPDNTSEYSIAANALYVPGSEVLANITAYLYRRNNDSGVNAHLSKLTGACADLAFSFPIGQVARVQATLMGLIPGNPANVADPGDPTYADDALAAPVLKGMDCYLGDVAVKPNQISLALGNQLAMGDNPAAAEGYDVAAIAVRRITGSINPRLTLLSTRDSFSDFVAGTKKRMWLRWGSTAGNRISVLVPEVSYTGAAPVDIGGLRGESLPFKAAGEDNGFYLSFY